MAHSYSLGQSTPIAWINPKVPQEVQSKVLYLPVAHDDVKKIPIRENGEELIDLLQVNNPRIKPFSIFDPRFTDPYDGYLKVRKGVYERLLKMLEILPANIGITYSEGFRTLQMQKKYFDQKFMEILEVIKDKELAYLETSKHVSPFINNIPPHCTGAAIDMSLFEATPSGDKLLDMGIYDFTFDPNDQHETFTEKTTQVQRENRLMLLSAATKAGLVNYGMEWWHFSYGDRVWAYVTKQKEALYDLVVPKNDPILSIDKNVYLKGFKQPS